MNDFIGVGNYFYEDSLGKGSLDLGVCHSQAEIDQAVRACQDAGTGHDFWGDWEVQPSQDLLRAVYAATVIYTTGDTV